MQPRYIQYSTYHVKLAFGGKEEVIRHDLAVYGARDTEKVRTHSSQYITLATQTFRAQLQYRASINREWLVPYFFNFHFIETYDALELMKRKGAS